MMVLFNKLTHREHHRISEGILLLTAAPTALLSSMEGSAQGPTRQRPVASYQGPRKAHRICYLAV